MYDRDVDDTFRSRDLDLDMRVDEIEYLFLPELLRVTEMSKKNYEMSCFN